MKAHLLLITTIIAGSAAIPFFARKFRLPSAALEMIFGIVLFNTVLHHPPEWFDLLKEIGLIYLMFIAGMELDIKRLSRGGRFYWYVLITFLSLLVPPFLFVWMGYPFFAGVAVSVFSAGMAIPVLKELKLMQTDYGRDITGITLTGEFLSILLLMGIHIFHNHGWTLMAGVETLKFIFLMALAAFSLKVLHLWAWWNPERVESVMESDDPVEEGIRAVISIAFTGALIAYVSGVEPILGSFMAGLIFGHVFKSKGRFEEKINAIGFGFFTPFFFIGVGGDLDIRLLGSFSSLSFSFFLTLMVLASNVFPLIFSPFMGISRLESVGMSLIFSAPFSMMVVASNLGGKMGFISEEMKSALILTALISGIFYPSLFRIVGKRMVVSRRGEGD